MDQYTALMKHSLELAVEWFVECGFGYDNIPDLYEKYKDEIKKRDMGYNEGLIYIITQEAWEREGKK